MALEQIIIRIGEEAASEAERVLGEARGKASMRIAAWRAKAAEEAGQVRRSAGDEAERLLRRAGAEARLEAGRKMLILKREELGKVTERALSRLLEKNTRLYGEILADALESHVDVGTTVILFSGDAATRKAAGEWLERRGGEFPGIKADFAPAGVEPRGGAVVRSGSVSINLSLQELLEELAARHIVDLSRALFGRDDE